MGKNVNREKRFSKVDTMSKKVLAVEDILYQMGIRQTDWQHIAGDRITEPSETHERQSRIELADAPRRANPVD